MFPVPPRITQALWALAAAGTGLFCVTRFTPPPSDVGLAAIGHSTGTLGLLTGSVAVSMLLVLWAVNSWYRRAA